jgi:hypothetical protein
MGDERIATDRDAGALNAGEVADDPPQKYDNGLDHAWRYFALHAQQRTSVFNFFIVLSGILATGIGAGFQAGKTMAPMVIILGILLTLFSIVFYRLDERGSELVKLAESALIAGENTCLPAFARVIAEENRRRVSAGCSTKTWTFGQSFRLIFWVMGIAGVVASASSLYRWAI